MNWNNIIFLAHASEDKPFVRKLYRELKDAGLEPWLDEENLKPGENWDDKIKEAIKNARFLIACLSSKSVSKNDYIQIEFKLALRELELKAANSNYFIPALIEDVPIPNLVVGTIKLSDYHAEKIYTTQGLKKLIQYLQELTNINEPEQKIRNPIFEKVRAAVSKGQPDIGLNLLNEYASARDLYNGDEVIMLMSRFNNIKKQNMMGSISQEQYLLQNNMLVKSILELNKNFEEESNN